MSSARPTPAGPTPASRDETRFALGIALAYLVAASAAALVHEPWRDEVEAWLVARDAASPLALLRCLRYEGHPSLWYAVLWPLTRLGGPELMQGAAVLIGTATTFVFARFAPFSRLVRALFAFGALQIWEWGAIARNYGLGALFLFGAAALAVRRERHPLLLGAALALAANTSLHAAMVAGGLLAFLALESLSWWRDAARAGPPPGWWSGLALGAAGQLACALTIWPPRDSGVGAMWMTRGLSDRLGKTLAAPVHGFATLPWGGALEGLDALRGLQVGLGVAATATLVFTSAVVLSRRRLAWLAAAIPAVALLALFFFRWYGGARHAGFLLLGLLVALWIAPSCPARGGAPGPLTALAQRALGGALAAVFGFQVTSALVQASLDARGVYSSARATAELVRASGLADLPMVADPDSSASNVVGMLGKRRAFYENVERWGSFPIFDARHGPANPHPDRAPDAAVFARAGELARGTAVVVVIDREADAEVAARARARLVGARRADVRKDESFWVYLVPASANPMSTR